MTAAQAAQAAVAAEQVPLKVQVAQLLHQAKVTLVVLVDGLGYMVAQVAAVVVLVLLVVTEFPLQHLLRVLVAQDLHHLFQEHQ